MWLSSKSRGREAHSTYHDTLARVQSVSLIHGGSEELGVVMQSLRSGNEFESQVLKTNGSLCELVGCPRPPSERTLIEFHKHRLLRKKKSM